MRQIEIRTLPRDVLSIREHGLLYLPRPYVVPGGRFNEMYGWDSYFIQVGLLRDGELERARDMVENFVYQILHYGTILNANRTYFLSRSQPPFLTRMILGVYEQTGDHGLAARARCPPSSNTTDSGPPSRTPCRTRAVAILRSRNAVRRRRSLADEKDESGGRTTTARVSTIARTTSPTTTRRCTTTARATASPTSSTRATGRCANRVSIPRTGSARSNVDVIHYAPVCLNTLLYIMEDDAARIMETLGDAAAAGMWRGRAASRRDADQPAAVGRAGRAVLRLQRPDASAAPLRFCDDVLSAVGGDRHRPPRRRACAGTCAKFEAPGGLLTSTRSRAASGTRRSAGRRCR